MERMFFVPPHIRALWVETQWRRAKAQQTGPYMTSEEEQRLIKSICSKPRMKMTADQVIKFMEELRLDHDEYNLMRVRRMSDELKLALEKEIYRGNQEALEVLYIFDLIASAPNAAFTQADEGYDVRICHLVKNREEWEKLKGQKWADVAFNGKTVKVLSIIEKPAMSEKQWQIANELGGAFWHNYDYWKIWFNLRTVCHYYVWVGRTTRKPTRTAQQINYYLYRTLMLHHQL